MEINEIKMSQGGKVRPTVLHDKRLLVEPYIPRFTVVLSF